MKTFLIVLVLAILFVVGSAMMMQYFTGRAAKKDPKSSEQNSANK